MLDKLLARFAQECYRLDADRWRLTLSNGRALSVSARHDDGFLLLDADTGASPAPAQLATLAEAGSDLPAVVKFALVRGSSSVRLRAEFPLPEEGGAADRIRRNLNGMLSALHRLLEPAPCQAAACPVEALPVVPLPELLKESGWDYHERPGGALLADLETGSRFLQAEINQSGAGARFRLTLYQNDQAAETARHALWLYLLEANAGLRFARGFIDQTNEGVAAGFEVRLETAPSPAEAGHALAALSVAGRHCAREMEVLKDAALAGIYRLARPPYHHSGKGA